MKKYKATTLVELIVSTILVGIIIAGVMAVDFSIRSTSRDAGSDVQMYLQVWALEAQISDAVRQVHGTFNDPGMYYKSSKKMMCFRHEDTAIAPTPQDFTDDKWKCFQQMPNPDSTIYMCDGVDNSVYNTAGFNCTTANLTTAIGHLANNQFTLGATLDPDFPNGKPKIVADPATGTIYFEMYLIASDSPESGIQCVKACNGQYYNDHIEWHGTNHTASGQKDFYLGDFALCPAWCNETWTDNNTHITYNISRISKLGTPGIRQTMIKVREKPLGF